MWPRRGRRSDSNDRKEDKLEEIKEEIKELKEEKKEEKAGDKKKEWDRINLWIAFVAIKLNYLVY